MPVQWHGKEYQKRLEKDLEKRMLRAMLFLVGQVKRSINRGNSGGGNPSAPGEPPKKVSTRLFQSITQEVDRDAKGIVGRFGTNVVYALRLELGFFGTDSKGRNYRQAPRPFLRPAPKKFAKQVLNILTGKGG